MVHCLTMAEPTTDIVGLLPQRACRNCVQIKVKCIPHSQQNDCSRICERCYRLGKDCTTPAPVVRKRRRLHSSKVAQLEDRINQLSSLLTPITSPDSTTNVASSVSTLSDNQKDGDPVQSQASHANEGVLYSSQRTPQRRDLDLPVTPSRSTRECESLSKDPVNDADVSLSSVIAPPHLHKDYLMNAPADLQPIHMDLALEQQLFNDYRKQWDGYLPFVLIPTSSEPRNVKRKRPFVYWCAVTVASMTRRDLNYALNEQLLRCISEQLFVKSHKSLDALQGLLILLTWYHYYSHMKPQVVNLLHLTQALVTDLGFTRPSAFRQKGKVCADLADMYHGRQVLVGMQTSDDRRALLGVFWCTSRMSLCFPRIEPLAFTRHMEDCCQELGAAMEFPSDAELLQVVQLQRIVSKYHPANHSSHDLPLGFLKSAILGELDDFVAKVPSDIQNRDMMLLEVEGCKFSLLGPGRHGNTGNTLESADLLHASLRAIDTFTTLLEACSPQQYMTMPWWYHFVGFMGILADMCFLRGDCWDAAAVREKYGFDMIMQRHVAQLERCKRYAIDLGSSDLVWRFGLYAEKTRRSIKWCEAKANLENRSAPAPDMTFMDSGLPDLGASLLAELDDPIWDTVMGDWTQYASGV